MPQVSFTTTPNSSAYTALRWRMVFLIFLLILGQGFLLHHVVTHQIEQIIVHHDEAEHCAFCAVGKHASADVPIPQLLSDFVWIKITPLFPSMLHITSCDVQISRARGPPLLSVV